MLDHPMKPMPEAGGAGTSRGEKTIFGKLWESVK